MNYNGRIDHLSMKVGDENEVLSKTNFLMKERGREMKNSLKIAYIPSNENWLEKRGGMERARTFSMVFGAKENITTV